MNAPCPACGMPGLCLCHLVADQHAQAMVQAEPIARLAMHAIKAADRDEAAIVAALVTLADAAAAVVADLMGVPVAHSQPRQHGTTEDDYLITEDVT